MPGVYTRERNGKRPLVCTDECSKQLIGETRVPIAAKPGRTACFDTEYVRNGTCDIFMFAAPLEGRGRAGVTERRTGKDRAEQIRKPADEDFPEAEKIVPVTDNLNTHAIASLYETYPAQEAKRIKDRLELHYTPEHRSWLNMAEIELSVINKQELPARVGTLEEMRERTRAWNEVRVVIQKV